VETVLAVADDYRRRVELLGVPRSDPAKELRHVVDSYGLLHDKYLKSS
jgi:hypothetical protein